MMLSEWGEKRITWRNDFESGRGWSERAKRFATTAHAYREFLAHDKLADRINKALAALDVGDVNALAKTGAEIRSWIVDTPFQPELDQAIELAFATMTASC